ncbi:MAG: Ku protein [Acidimicrobiales bacterium]
MPQAIWSGSISFGLVNIPVKLYRAVTRKNVRFHLLDARSRSPIRQKRVSAETGEEVPWEQVVKGYELSSGDYVVVTDEELAALDPEALRTIEVEEFVDLATIDPIFYDSAYYVAPDSAAKPYALLARAMEQEGKVAIAHVVLRTRQHLVAIRPKDGLLVLSTMVYADEINDPMQIPELAELGDLDLAERELAMARQLITTLSTDFEPEKFHDTYREAVLDLIERKAQGEQIVTAIADAQPAPVVDLMAALEASVAAAARQRRRGPSADGSPGEDGPASSTGSAANDARSVAG